MDKTRIILITVSFPFGKGEASFIMPELPYLLQSFDVTFVSRNTKDEQTTNLPEEVEVVRYPASNMSAVSFIKGLPRLLNKAVIREMFKVKSLSQLIGTVKFVLRGADIARYLNKMRRQYNQPVIYYTYWNDYAAYGVSRFCRKNGDKAISRIHGGDLYLRPTNKYFLPFKAEIARNLDKMVFISHEGRNYFINTYKPNNEDNLTVCYMGTENKLGVGFGSKDDVLRIVSLSNVTFGKRVDLIAKALTLIDDVKIEWVHFGDGEEMPKLKEAVNDLDKKDNIKYSLSGYVSNSEVKSFFAGNPVDLLVNVSYSEGLPISMVEAASFGIPIIGTDVGGVREVATSENGFLLNRDFEVEELADLLVKYYNMPASKKESVRQASRHLWENRFVAGDSYLDFTEMLKGLQCLHQA